MSSINGKQLQDNTIVKVKTTTELVAADGTRAFTAAQSMGGFKITNLATPTVTTDAATKGYVDTATPAAAGSDTQLQYNNGGVLGATNGLVYDDVNSRLVIQPTAYGPPFPASTAALTIIGGYPATQSKFDIKNGSFGSTGSQLAAVIDLTAYSPGLWLGALQAGAAWSGSTYNGLLNMGQTTLIQTYDPGGSPGPMVLRNSGGGGRIFIGNNAGGARFGVIVDPVNNVVIGSNGDTSGGLVTATAMLEIRGVTGIAALVVNETGANADTRIESNGNANAFFLDANNGVLGTTGAIGLSTGTPVSGLDVQTSQGLKRTTVADTDYTVLDTDYLIAYTSIAAARTVNLPTAVGRTGRTIVVKDESGSASVVNTITVDPSGAETIDGVGAYTVTTARGRVHCYSDGANWHVLSN